MSLWVHGDLFSKTIVLNDTSVSVCHSGLIHGDLFSKTIVLDDTSISVCDSGFTVIYLVKLLYWMIQAYPCVTLGSR